MTFRRSELDLTWSRIDNILGGSRAEMLDAAKARGVAQRCVTPAFTRFGKFYVLQLSEGWDTRCAVRLACEDGGATDVPLEGATWYYRQALNTAYLDKIMDALDRDYPPASLTNYMVWALADVVKAWLAAKREHRNYLARRDLADVVRGRLGPFLRAWTTGEPDPMAMLSAVSRDGACTVEARLFAVALRAALSPRPGLRAGGHVSLRELDETLAATLNRPAWRLAHPPSDAELAREGEHEAHVMAYARKYANREQEGGPR